MKRIIIAFIVIILFNGCYANALMEQLDYDDEKLEQLLEEQIEKQIEEMEW